MRRNLLAMLGFSALLCSCGDTFLEQGGPGNCTAVDVDAETAVDDQVSRVAARRKQFCKTHNSAEPTVHQTVVSSGPLVLSRVENSVVPVDTPNLLHVYGSGFLPGDQVWVGSKLATTQYIIAGELAAMVPARSDLFGATPVEVHRANGKSIKRRDLLRYVVQDFGWNRLTISSGYSPTSIVVDDFNGDGFLDLTASNLVDPEVMVVFGDGTGDFPDLEITYPDDPLDNPRSYDAVSGDWDADGKQDLALAQGPSHEVRILWGNGGGLFPNSSRLITTIRPYALASVDVDHDGWVDLVAVGRQPDNVVILRNQQRRQFKIGESWSTGIEPIAVALAKIRNGSKFADLVVANQGSGNLSLFLNDPSEGFLPSSLIPTCADPRSVTAADLNHDDKLDVVVACQQSGLVCTHLGDGLGGFGRQNCIPLGLEPISVITSDLDGDGHLDLAVAHYQGIYGSILRGNGDGSFRLVEKFHTGRNSTRIVATDFNRDGRPDLVVSNLSSGYTTVHIHSANK